MLVPKLIIWVMASVAGPTSAMYAPIAAAVSAIFYRKLCKVEVDYVGDVVWVLVAVVRA